MVNGEWWLSAAQLEWRVVCRARRKTIYHSPFTLIELPFAYVREVARDPGGGGRHLGADEVRASAASLSAFEVSVARRGAALAGLQGVCVHREAHRAAS